MEQAAMLRFPRRLAAIGETLQAQESKLQRIVRDLINLSIPRRLRLLPQLRHLDTRPEGAEAEAEAQVVVAAFIEDLLEVYVEVGFAGASASAATQLVLLGDALPGPIPLHAFLPADDDDLRKACCCLDSVSSKTQELQDCLGGSLASLYTLRFLLPAHQFAVPYKDEVVSGLRNAVEKAKTAAKWAIEALENINPVLTELQLEQHAEKRKESLCELEVRMDYLERAKRQEEAPLLQQAFREQASILRDQRQKLREDEINHYRMEHNRLSRMLQHKVFMLNFTLHLF
ncbi:hypothetical protein E2562_012665 [Oryza meyeriana var. granulata]|uniref:Uncharacterized protein n=1 Tax=Oryza meyeriana var. granulata TaxID=110450 RepID=A0A6G1CFQ6_9ORYZ|nr:hypothetical protein E2562_012665 [Oryza meyeriana var. granulata]